MSVLGKSVDITKQLSSRQATVFAQWIGASNVMRNQKIKQFESIIAAGGEAGQDYAEIKKRPELSFLKSVPVQILRNAASTVFSDLEACRKGIRKFPKIKARHKKRNCLITREMFYTESLSENTARICIFDHAKKKRNVIFSLVVPVAADQVSNQLRISRQGAKFWLSFSFDDGICRQTNEEILHDLSHLKREELIELVTGADRGVARPIQTSNGLTLTYSPEEVAKLKMLDAKRRHYQRILARKKRLNGNKSKKCETAEQQKLQHQIGQCNRKIANIRLNSNHHWSKGLADHTVKVLALEDLNLTGMTKRAKPKKQGRKYARNNGRAKSGLNRSLLHVALGRIADFTKYKLNLQGKAWVLVNPAGTSQIHNKCKTKDQTERPDQATFKCHRCGTTENADVNASLNIRDDGVTVIIEGTFSNKKPRKKTAIRKTKSSKVVPDQHHSKNQSCVGIAV